MTGLIPAAVSIKDNDNMLSRQEDTLVYPFHSWVREIVDLNDLKWPIWNGYLMLLISSPTNWPSWVIVCHCDDCADDGEWDSVKILNLYRCLPILTTSVVGIISAFGAGIISLYFPFYKCMKHLPAVTLRQTRLLFCYLRESKEPINLKNNDSMLEIHRVRIVKEQRHLL